MQNLKIRVNNEAESKEAQELFFALGYGFEGNTVKETQEFEYTGVFYLFAYGADCDLTHSCDLELFNSKPHREITLPELRAMVNQDQDEPFLTPETTLNDQYAEIEEVRQSAIKVSHNPNQQPKEIRKNSIEGTLSQRQSQYGCFEDVAQVTQQILAALRIGNYDELPAPMKESLHMIASKMARIVNGDPEYLDNWHDIGGYAKLIEKLIKGE